MNAVVLDTNVAVDWFIPSAEGDADSLPLETLQAEGKVSFYVPLHFDVEVVRVLRKHHMRNSRRPCAGQAHANQPALSGTPARAGVHADDALGPA